MKKVILTHDGTVLKEYPIDQERLVIGRMPQNDIQLDDPTVSGEHAAIVNDKHSFIEDLKSTNGVFVNGNKVSHQQLRNRDVITIGRHKLQFIDDQADEFERTVIIHPDEPEPRQAPSKAEKRYQVRVTSGPRQGNCIDLTKPFTSLGSPELQVAMVAKRGKEFFLMPVKGTGANSIPPKLNGKPVTTTSQRLSEGDKIEVAGIELEFISVG